MLKSKGLIPKQWDLRKKLSSGQKSWITKQKTKYQQIVEHPEKFASRVYSTKKAKQMKSAGFYGEGNHILIPNFGDKRSRTIVREDTITIRRRLRIGYTASRKPIFGPEVEETIYLHTGPNLLKLLKRKYPKALPKGEYWAFKLGDNNTFIDKWAKNLNQLSYYNRALFDLEEDEEDDERGNLRIHLVRFRFTDGQDHMQASPPKNDITMPNANARKYIKGRGNK